MSRVQRKECIHGREGEGSFACIFAAKESIAQETTCYKTLNIRLSLLGSGSCYNEEQTAKLCLLSWISLTCADMSSCSCVFSSELLVFFQTCYGDDLSALHIQCQSLSFLTNGCALYFVAQYKADNNGITYFVLILS